MNILEELYYGNINPNDKSFDYNSDYGKFIKTISDNEEKLSAYLNAIPTASEEQHLFSELMNAEREVLCISEFERFIEGFQLGAKFIMDTFLIERYSPIKNICE